MSEEERIYLEKIKRYGIVYGAGMSVLISCLGLVFIFSIVSNKFDILVVYFAIFLGYSLITPIYYEFSRPRGFGIWIDWEAYNQRITPIYMMFVGAITTYAVTMPILSLLVGFNFELLRSTMSGILLFIVIMVSLYAMNKFMRKRNMGKRVMKIKFRVKKTVELVDRALLIIGLKSNKEWIGSKWTGFLGYRIVSQNIHYHIVPVDLYTIILMKPETADSISKLKAIECAISKEAGGG